MFFDYVFLRKRLKKDFGLDYFHNLKKKTKKKKLTLNKQKREREKERDRNGKQRQ